VRGYIALVSDITAQKQIEMTLREQAELLDVAASRAESHVWMMQLSAFETADDQNGAIISQLQSILGLSDGHSAGTAANLSHRIPAEDQAQIRHSATRHLAGETDFHEVEYRLQHDDGEIHWIYSRGKLQRDEDGRPLRWLGVDWDITRWRGEIKE
jgi:PAS domain S-box-containing protein